MTVSSGEGAAVRQPYQYQTAAQTLERIVRGTAPWVAIGDFLDDWRRCPPEKLSTLVAEPLGDCDPGSEPRRWAAFCAATVEWLCWNEHLPFPEWTRSEVYVLPEPWFLYPGWRLRAWQLVTTPAPYKMRNIFGGDRMLDRV